MSSTVSVKFDGDPATHGLASNGTTVLKSPKMVSAPCGGTSGLTTQSSSPFVDTFTPGAPSYSGSDANVDIYAQVSYGSASLPVAFAATPSTALKSVATGNVLVAAAVRSPGTCTYSKPAVSVYYPFHWSCPTHSTSVTYVETGQFVFRVNIGGNTGTATIDWTLRYAISRA